MALKWGIISTGKISHDFVTAIGTLSNDDHKVVSIAARDLYRAKEFANTHDIQHFYGSYIELAQDVNVEVVYIGTSNSQHSPIAGLMLQNGKHVLCEKPMCINEKEVKNLVKLAEEKQLFLMEGMWSRFFPAYHYLRDRVTSGALGEITRITVNMGFPFDDVNRLANKISCSGSLFVLGVYPIQIAQLVFGGKIPISIQSNGVLNNDGCDLEFNVKLDYGNNQIAHISASLLKPLDNVATIVGTKGEIVLNDFWAPEILIDVDGTKKSWPLPLSKHEFNLKNSCGLRYEAEAVRLCIKLKQLESDAMSHNESILIARIEDEIRRQIGVRYPADDE